MIKKEKKSQACQLNLRDDCTVEIQWRALLFWPWSRQLRFHWLSPASCTSTMHDFGDFHWCSHTRFVTRLLLLFLSFFKTYDILLLLDILKHFSLTTEVWSYISLRLIVRLKYLPLGICWLVYFCHHAKMINLCWLCTKNVFFF